MSFFYLPITLTTSLIYKTSVYPLHFSIFKGYKKIIDLKSKTKYMSPKTLAQQQKLLIAKLKKIKSNQQILPKTNNLAL